MERVLKLLDTKATGFDKKMARRYNDLKGAVLHNPEDGRRMMNE
jgi:hypothetical protein